MTLFDEIHLDVVLEVLLIVGIDFFSTKLVDRYYRMMISQEDSLKKLGLLIYKWQRYFNFSTIKEKTSSRSLSYKKFDNRRNDQIGRYS